MSVPFFVLFGLTKSYAYLTFALMCLSALIPSVAFVWMLRDSINERRRTMFAYGYLTSLLLSYVAIMTFAGR